MIKTPRNGSRPTETREQAAQRALYNVETPVTAEMIAKTAARRAARKAAASESK